MEKDCIFCQIVSGKIPCHKIYEDEKYLAFLDINPITPGHALVVPKNHSSDMLHCSPEDRKELLETVAKIVPAILKATQTTAFNVGINTGRESGQIVFHTHGHIIPRKVGDGLKTWEGKTPSQTDLGQLAQKIRENR